MPHVGWRKGEQEPSTYAPIARRADRFARPSANAERNTREIRNSARIAREAAKRAQYRAQIRAVDAKEPSPKAGRGGPAGSPPGALSR